MEQTASNPITGLMRKIMDSEPPAFITDVHDQVDALLDDYPEIRTLLEGREITGTPLHPALVHFPIGATFSAAVLDLGGSRVATTAVQSFAVLAALPTAAAGLADYLSARDDKKVATIGSAHAAAAAIGTTLLGASTLSRLGRSHGAARVLLWGACLGYLAAGMLGGELVYGDAEQLPDPDAPEPPSAPPPDVGHPLG